MELIPAIDLRGGQCVRLRQGDYARETVFSEDPSEMASRWQGEGAQRVHLVDLDGAREGRIVNREALVQIVNRLEIPCQLGGGIRDERAIRTVLEEIGIGRAIVGTQALKQPDWFENMVEQFPGRIALGLDARDSMVATEGWLEVSKIRAIELAQRYVGLPLAAVIYTNIANDGMMQGVDEQTLDDMEALAGMGLPVIASGGVSSLTDIRNLLTIHRREPGLVGAIIGRALYEGAMELHAALSEVQDHA